MTMATLNGAADSSGAGVAAAGAQPAARMAISTSSVIKRVKLDFMVSPS
ncbi:MAG: hypothetical protein ACYCXH_05100 [Bellilinea sp.]